MPMENICSCEGRFSNAWESQGALDPGQHAGLFLAHVGVRDSGGCKSFTPALRFWSFSVPEETR